MRRQRVAEQQQAEQRDHDGFELGKRRADGEIVVASALSTLGLVVLSAGQATLIGLACAAWLGMSVVLFRAASLALGLDSFPLAASFTLLIVLLMQIAIMSALIAWREQAQVRLLLRHWRPAALVGVSGGLASVGWFSAFTLQNATYVRALGQIELGLTFIATLLFFQEKVTRAEIVGILLIVAAILVVLLSQAPCGRLNRSLEAFTLPEADAEIRGAGGELPPEADAQ